MRFGASASPQDADAASASLSGNALSKWPAGTSGTDSPLAFIEAVD